jgi:GT2 family glycosyltransferase
MTTRVIVLNWNGRSWLERCLPALAAQRVRATEVVVVDNASTDDSVAWIRATHPWVQVVALTENLGFAAGNNRGAEGATVDALVFLNNDTEPEAGWLEALVSAAHAEPSRALVTSQLVYWSDPATIDSAGDGYLRCGGGFKVHHGQPTATAPGSREGFGACGAAFLIRREWFERLGGFDETLFMVYEDVDLSYRARLFGATVWYAADACVRHGGSASLGRVSDLAVMCGQRNLEWVWLVNTPTPLLWRSWWSHLLYTVVGGVVYLRQGRGGAWWRGKWAVLREWRRIRARRAEVQAGRGADVEALWRMMDADWIAIKRAEKRFDFSPKS